jgi:hypothetical protein
MCITKAPRSTSFALLWLRRLRPGRGNQPPVAKKAMRKSLQPINRSLVLFVMDVYGSVGVPTDAATEERPTFRVFDGSEGETGFRL